MRQNKRPNHAYTAWSIDGQIYSPFYMEDGKPPIRELPPGCYEYQDDPNWDSYWLARKSDAFTFQHEIYKVDNFTEQVLKSYDARKLSTGILFNGRPGTGKTVQAKLLANASGLPIIYVAQEPGRLFLNFISRVSQPICWVFDEFEKYVGRTETAMLSILDGVFRNELPHIFIFTTNPLDINDRFIGRPSRIRYIKTFDKLPCRFFEEYIRGALKDQSLYDQVFDYVKDHLTMDVVKSVVDEVNTIGFDREMLDTLNIKRQ